MRKKFWIIVTIISTLLLSGCVSEESKSANITPSGKSFKRFQSVALEKTTMLQTGANKYACPICGMKLPMFYKTNHSATHNGKVKQYCSLHCLVDDKYNNKSDLKNIKVVAIDTLKFIDAKDAIYVVGSDKSATMSSLSKYAFEGRMSARRFAKENQGRIMKFDEAYEYALKDFAK